MARHGTSSDDDSRPKVQGVKLRRATATDVALLLGLIGESTSGVAEALYGEGGLRACLLQEASLAGLSACVVAEHGARVIGERWGYGSGAAKRERLDDQIPAERRYILEPFRSSPLPDSWYLSSLAVDQAYRGRGIGSRLLRSAAEQAKAEGYETIALHVFEEKSIARTLYRKCGFTVIGRASPPVHPAITARSDLILMAASVTHVISRLPR